MTVTCPSSDQRDYTLPIQSFWTATFWQQALPCCNPNYIVVSIVDFINKPLWGIPETAAHQQAKLFFYVIIFLKDLC